MLKKLYFIIYAVLFYTSQPMIRLAEGMEKASGSFYWKSKKK